MTGSTPARLLTIFLLSIGLAACGEPEITGANKILGSGGSDNGEGGSGATDTVDPGLGECEPQSCADLARDCGQATDGCGEIIDCGTCDDDALCGIIEANTCTALEDLCQPLTEEEACADKECGFAGDGCKEVYECGTCDGAESCGALEAHQCDVPTPYAPDDCPAEILSCLDPEAEGADCGIIGNGCGGTLDCTEELGDCPAGEYCGFGGPNKCGEIVSDCEPLTPAEACNGKCGVVSNGCGVEVDGGIIDCTATFPCPQGEVCGGAGVPNECGSGDGLCEPILEATACAGKACGSASDGCDSSYVCGTCDDDQMCQAGVCQPLCVPILQATACAGKFCGTVGDGCGDTYSCGTCDPDETCGLIEAFVCDETPPPVCVPLTQGVACAGKECGTVLDGCGTAPANEIDCGAFGGGCGPGEFCSIEQTFQCDAPTPPDCIPATSCADLGWACGDAVDDCGNVFPCEDEGRGCNSLETCVGGITGPTECVSDGTTGDCDLCDDVPDCAGEPQLTILTGRVVTPGRDNNDTGNQVGVPNAFVYILQTNNVADLPAFTDGVDGSSQTCGNCSDESLGPVLASALTDSHGEYTIEGNVPVGTEFLLVVKVGKFRRAQHYTLAPAAACETTDLTAVTLANNPTRLPRSMNHDGAGPAVDDGLAVNIPHVAISTGSADGMECVFEKIGILHDQFTRPQLSGRIHLYRSNGVWPDQQSEDCDDCGSSADTCIDNNCDWTPPNPNNIPGDEDQARLDFLAAVSDQSLVADDGRLNEYDMVVFDCQGGGWAHEDANEDANVLDYVNRGGRMFTSHYSRHWICDNGTDPYEVASPYDTGMTASATFDCDSDGDTEDSGTGIVSLGRPGVTPAHTLKLNEFASWLVNEGAATFTDPDYEFDITDPRDLAEAVGASSEEFVYRTDGDPSPSVQQFAFDTPYGGGTDAACGRVAYSGFHVSGGSSGVFPGDCSGALTDQEKVLLYMLFDLGGCVGDVPEPPECNPVPCAANTCGTLPDGCGDTQECECDPGLVCNGTHTCEPPGCVETTCEAENVLCGFINDGCGDVLDCGDCPVCTPIDEATACAGKCGFVSDGCSGVYECPIVCETGVCANGVCTDDSCVPAECPEELECGFVSDGCDGVAACGVCVAPEGCGVNMPNMCDVPVCQPLTCEDVGAECGMIGDGCGDAVQCPPCPDGQFCGGQGMPNMCVGCVPITCEDVDAQCGAIGDGCGDIVQCGPCPLGDSCGVLIANQCGPTGGCNPLTCGDLDAECGLIGDGCDEIVDCGPCPPGEVCGIETPFQCGPPPPCTPLTCEDVDAECGLIGDGCDDVVDCGECPDDGVCGAVEPNQCSSIK